MTWTRLIASLVSLGALVACNPVSFDPQVSYPGFEVGRAEVDAAAPVWVEAKVTGATGHAVYAVATVRAADVVGPTDRSCVENGAIVACEVENGEILQPGQVLLGPDGSWSRTMTVWPDEVVEVWLVCVDETTNDLSCPDSLRLGLRSVDGGGTLVGDLTPEP